MEKIRGSNLFFYIDLCMVLFICLFIFLLLRWKVLIVVQKMFLWMLWLIWVNFILLILIIFMIILFHSKAPTRTTTTTTTTSTTTTTITTITTTTTTIALLLPLLILLHSYLCVVFLSQYKYAYNSSSSSSICGVYLNTDIVHFLA